MQHMYPIRQAVTIAIFLAGLLQVSRVEADFHLVQIDEVMAGMNGDANVQFIEITMSAQGQNCQGTGNHNPPGNTADHRCDNVGPGAKLVFFDASGLPINEFIFPGDTPNFEAGRSILIATQRFADLDTTPPPDFIMPAFIQPNSGKVCYMNRDNAPFGINLCLAYGNFTGAPDSVGIAPALPITGNLSLKRVNNTFNNAIDFALDTPAPCNNAGVCGTPSARNTPPVANLQSVITAEDTAITITLTGSDPEGDPLTFSIVATPTNGVLSGVAPNLTYTPNLNFNGSDSFTFKVDDGRLDSDVAMVSITVTAVNDTPTATSQAVSTAAGTAVTITLMGSDPEGEPLAFTIVTPPAHGTLSAITDTSCTAGICTATVTFTPTVTIAVSDSFAFMVSERAPPRPRQRSLPRERKFSLPRRSKAMGGPAGPVTRQRTISP